MPTSSALSRTGRSGVSAAGVSGSGGEACARRISAAMLGFDSSDADVRPRAFEAAWQRRHQRKGQRNGRGGLQDEPRQQTSRPRPPPSRSAPPSARRDARSAPRTRAARASTPPCLHTPRASRPGRTRAAPATGPRARSGRLRSGPRAHSGATHRASRERARVRVVSGLGLRLRPRAYGCAAQLKQATNWNWRSPCRLWPVRERRSISSLRGKSCRSLKMVLAIYMGENMDLLLCRDARRCLGSA